jgi:MFS family permease
MLLTDNFMHDVGINQDQFNVGQQMLSLGIVLLEIPSNMILYRVGLGKWLALQLFLFGTVSTFQAFQHGYGAFIATRSLLGITESGFIPGGLWTLSTWYTRRETAKRVMIFYFGNQFGQASSKLLAYGILHMRGLGGKPGWFWLFVLMGAFTVILWVRSRLLSARLIQEPPKHIPSQHQLFHRKRAAYLADTCCIGRSNEGK